MMALCGLCPKHGWGTSLDGRCPTTNGWVWRRRCHHYLSPWRR